MHLVLSNLLISLFAILKYVHQNLPPTRHHAQGRWFNHTALTKDQWVEASTTYHIQRQIGFERNRTLWKMNRDFYGHVGHVRRRFYKRPNCQRAFKSLFCWINFPRCDFYRDLTMPTCRSACENFFRSCNYQRGLWRCGKSKYFNGYEPEEPNQINGTMTYMREYFPGQPFRQNKYTTGGGEFPVCTPALLGSATSLRSNVWLGLVAVALLSGSLWLQRRSID